MNRKFIILKFGIIIIGIIMAWFSMIHGETIKEKSVLEHPIIAVELSYTLEPGND